MASVPPASPQPATPVPREQPHQQTLPRICLRGPAAGPDLSRTSWQAPCRRPDPQGPWLLGRRRAAGAGVGACRRPCSLPSSGCTELPPTQRGRPAETRRPGRPRGHGGQPRACRGGASCAGGGCRRGGEPRTRTGSARGSAAPRVEPRPAPKTRKDARPRSALHLEGGGGGLPGDHVAHVQDVPFDGARDDGGHTGARECQGQRASLGDDVQCLLGLQMSRVLA